MTINFHAVAGFVAEEIGERPGRCRRWRRCRLRGRCGAWQSSIASIGGMQASPSL